MTRIFLLLSGLFLTLSSFAYAEEGPVGPAGPSTSPITEGTNPSDGKKGPVDLPYKPTKIKQKKIISTEDGSVRAEKNAREIPYMSSQSPEPVGASDPPY